jgi:hypothetical protein
MATKIYPGRDADNRHLAVRRMFQAVSVSASLDNKVGEVGHNV